MLKKNIAMRYFSVNKCILFCLPAILTIIVILPIIKKDFKDDKLDLTNVGDEDARKERRNSESHSRLQNVIRNSIGYLDIELGDIKPENLSCHDCDPEEMFLCPKGKRKWIKDKKVPIPYANRAILTTPDGFIVKKSGLPKAGLGVWTTQNISKCVVFGPFVGVREYDDTQPWGYYAYSWQIMDEHDAVDHYVDAKDPTRSNWLRYINMPMTKDEANVDFTQYRQDIYYQVKDAITADQELLIWYGKYYAKHLRLPGYA